MWSRWIARSGGVPAADAATSLATCSSVVPVICSPLTLGSDSTLRMRCSAVELKGNTVRNNSATGVLINDGTSGCQVHGNLSYGNYNRLGSKVRTPFTLTGWASKIERDILLRGTLTAVTIGTNNYQ